MNDLKKLGQLLLENGHLTREQIQAVLKEQEGRPKVAFGQICVDLGFLTQEQLQYLLKRFGKKLVFLL